MFRPIMTITELVKEWEYATIGEKFLIGLHIILDIFLYALLILFCIQLFL
jgi:hypothetical protein